MVGVETKIKMLKCILKDCLTLSNLYRKRYLYLKKVDDRIDFFNATSSGTAIILIVIGFTNPVCLLASAILSGINFVVSRGQDKLNFKSKYTQHLTTFQQYTDLAREIQVVMTKNNLTSDQYQDYIDELTSKRSLIEDSQLI